MHEDKFRKLPIEVAGDTSPADAEVESKVRSAMEQRITKSQARQ